jgi:diaminopimelate epimerase
MCASFLSAKNKNVINDFVQLSPKSGENLEVRFDNNTLYFKGSVKETFIAEFKDTE